MERKKIMQFLTAAAIALLGFCTTACDGGSATGSDVTGSNYGNTTANSTAGIDSRLVGVWYRQVSQGSNSYNSYYSYYEVYQFDASGHCKYGEWRAGSETEWTDDDVIMTWQASGGRLTITEKDDEGYEVEEYNYTVSSDGRTLTLKPTRYSGQEKGRSWDYDESDSPAQVYTKQ